MVPRKALGSGGLKNVVEVVDAIGADGVAEIAGWHQAYGSREAASMKERKLVIAADVLGTVDKSDMAAEKAVLKQHGYFAHEDAQWAADHSPQEMRAERERSAAELSSRLCGGGANMV